MKRKERQMRQKAMLMTLGVSMTLLFALGVNRLQAQTNSAANLPSSDTPATRPAPTPTPKKVDADNADADANLRRACADAVSELKAARKLIEAQDRLIKYQGDLNALERQFSDGLKNLRTLDAAEKDGLRTALNEKDKVIAALEAEIVVLKKKRNSWWKSAKTFVIGAAAGVVIGTVLLKK